MSILFEILVICLLVGLNAWFALSEMAIVSSRRARLAAKAAEGDKGAKAALELADNPGRFLSCVQIGITLVGVLAGAYSGATLADQLAAALIQTVGLSKALANALSIALVVGAITMASLILGELVPKRVALAAPETIAARVARPMTRLAHASGPMVRLLERSTQAVLDLLSIKRQADQTVTEEEVKAMIAEGTETGIFDPREQELLSGVMRLGGRSARALMTPWADLSVLDLDWDQDRLLHALRHTPHTRLPVCRGGREQVIGILHTKDVMDSLLAGSPLDLPALVRPLPAIPESADALKVLDVLNQDGVHMALVVDEYGVTEGVITSDDILTTLTEGLFGPDPSPETGLVRREDGSWLLDGDLASDLVADKLECRLLHPIHADHTTLAGFILSHSGTLPHTGWHFTTAGWRFEVVDMDGLRIDKILAQKVEDED